jgi:hypothetical protein
MALSCKASVDRGVLTKVHEFMWPDGFVKFLTTVFSATVSAKAASIFGLGSLHLYQ